MSNKTMSLPGAHRAAIIAAAIIVCSALTPVQADDGIWLWNQRPKELSTPVGAAGASGKNRPSANVTDAFANDLRLATVRLNKGSGSGSFISANGLVLTNQHLISTCIAKVSTKDHDYTTEGFYAPSQGAEIACPGF